MEKVGQLSEDGQYYWDSQQWVPAFSRDGNWRWDGRVWVPAQPPKPPAAAAGSKRFLIWLPGFRSRSFWKMALAVVGYSIIAFLIGWGLAPASWDKLAIGLGALAAVQIGGNRALRQRLPLFRSTRKWLAGLAWFGLALIVLTVVVSTQPPPTRSNALQQQARLNSPATTPWSSPQPATSPSPSPTPPSPVAATPSPKPQRIVLVTPKPRPSPKPSPPSTCGAPANPFGYDFCPPATLIYTPAPSFCSYFKCVDAFWSTSNGYVEECGDGSYTHAGGVEGACEGHGSPRQPLYS